MSVDNASMFLAGSILIMSGLVIIVIGIVAINNVISKYWKPVTIFTVDSFGLFGQAAADRYIENHPEAIAARRATEEERIIPTLDPILEEKNDINGNRRTSKK